MQNSNALSPEVRSLFETVKQQARKYSEAFDYIELEKNELVRRKEEFNTSEEEFRQSINRSIEELKSDISGSLVIIKEKTDESLLIFNDLDKIRLLQESLENLKKVIQERIDELDNVLSDFRNKSDIELQNELVKIRGNVERELEGLAQKIEVRVSINMKKMEGRLLNYDQKLYALSDNQQRAVNAFNDEMDKLKNDILLSKSSNTEFKQEIYRKFDEFDLEFRSQLKSLKYKTGNNIDTRQEIDSDNYIDKDLYREEKDLQMSVYNNLADKIDMMKKRELIWIYLTIMSMISIMVLFYFIFK